MRASRRPRTAAAALAIVLAFPAGGALRGVVDAWLNPPLISVVLPVNALVDANPAEAELNRFVVSTDRDAKDLAREAEIVEAVAISPGRVAIATPVDLRRASQIDGVIDVDRDVTRSFRSDDQYFSYQWPLENVGQTVGTTGTPGADINWTASRGYTDGTGVVVAVIDSGIDFSHPDLRHALWQNPGEVCGNRVDDDANGYVDDCNGWDFVNNDNQQFDLTTSSGTRADNRHGTHIAGTIAAAADNDIGIAGVAPGVKIMPLKVMEGGSFPGSRTVNALNYAVANGASVVNASYGGRGMSVDEQAAVANATTKGVVIAAAAGNSASNNDLSPQYPASHPAEAIVAVASSDNRDAQSSFSCWGPTSVDLHAPGTSVASTQPGGQYALMSGTSMAAPHVAGAVALLRSLRPDLSLAATRQALFAALDPVPALAGKTVTGGRLDVGNLVAAAAKIGITFDGLEAFDAGGQHTAEVVIADPSGILGGAARPQLRATLGVLDEGHVRAVVDHGVSGSVTNASGVVTLPFERGARGRASVPSARIPLTTALPAGDYALLVEVVDARDPSVVVAQRIALWSIAPEVANQPAPTPTPTNTPAPPGGGGGATPPPAGTTPAPAPSDPSPPPQAGPAPGPQPPPAQAPAPGEGTQPAPPVAQQPAPQPPDGATQPAPQPPTSQQPAPQPPAEQQPQPPPERQPGPRPPVAPPLRRPPGLPPDEAAPLPPGEPAPPPPGDATTPAPDSYRVTPDRGSTRGGDLVTVWAPGLSADVYVWFGGSVGTTLFADSSTATVRTPAHVAGTVDVTIYKPSGHGIVVTRAYTFVDDSSAPPPSGTSPPPNGTSPPPGGTSPPPGGTSPPPGGTTPPPGGTSPPPATPDPGTEPTPPRVRSPGEIYTGSNGLKLAVLPDGHPLARLAASDWRRGACRTSPCTGMAR